MKHLDEYRDAETARRLAASIHREADTDRRYRLMEFCGGHTHAIFRYGIEDLLPANIEMVHGPGCPVCVLPTGRLDMAIRLAKRDGVILASYGDMLRVPGSKGQSLMKAKADGADIRMVYSTLDALKLAEANPDREVSSSPSDSRPRPRRPRLRSRPLPKQSSGTSRCSAITC
jgi:Hydrogenase maturation factor